MSTSLKEICSLVQKRMKSYFYLILDGNLHSFQGMAATHSRENVLFNFLDFLGYFTFNANDEIEAKLVEGVTKRGGKNLAFKTVKENILWIKKRQRFVLQKDFSFSVEGRLGISQFILLCLSTDFLIQNKIDFSTSVFENLQIFYKTINASHNLLFLDSVYRMISYLEGSTCMKHASVLASTTKKFIDPLEFPVSCLDAFSVLSFSDDYHWLYPERRDINNLYIQQVYNFSYSNKNIR